jgi:predicted outer membrane repeat protein
VSRNVTLVRAAVAGNVAAGGDGGGIWTGARSLVLRDCSIRGNSSGNNGGGIHADNAATLTNCTVVGNSAEQYGGGINAPNGTVTLTATTVSSNRAGRNGGGIDTETAIVINSTINGNSAGAQFFNGDGGGIFARTATLTNSIVSGNSAADSGGGLVATTSATLTRCTVSGNAAPGSNGGGGIWTSQATLTNCTVSGNSAQLGGGVYAGGGTLTNVTITQNRASMDGGGVLNTSNTTPISVKNTLIAGNLVDVGGTGPDASGVFSSSGHNLVGIRDGGTGFITVIIIGFASDLTGTAANPLDPRLGPLAANGGRTRTHALLAGSPAIDQGDNSGAPPSDQRGAGFRRLKDGNGDRLAFVDIGAFER